MVVAYRAPGVYREEVFLQPEVTLPTGVPGFIGLADAIAGLENLPEGIQFPDSLPEPLKDKVDYDSEQKLLIFKGVMSAQVKSQLLTLSPDPLYRRAVEELFQNAQQAVVALHRQEEFTDKLLGLSDGYLTEAVIGFFENGGIRCYVSRADPSQNRETALKKAINVLAPLSDLDLVAVPDAMTLLPPLPDDPRRTEPITQEQWQEQVTAAEPAVVRVQREMLVHCAAQGDRLAILDAIPQRTPEEVKNQRNQITVSQKEPVNGVLYYPWIKNNQDYPPPENPQKGRLVPPCGHIAGIFARSDRARGVFKAPANQEIRDALDLEASIDNSVQAQLNPEGINCLRAFPGRGLRIWGARTLSRDLNWRYVNVRRLFLTLGRWIDQNMSWANFEPNAPQLWVRIQRELSPYLTQLWRAGALRGQTPEQAFYVKCDAETNPPETREAGQVVTEIGLAAGSPAEFVVVRIIHRAGTTPTPPTPPSNQEKFPSDSSMILPKRISNEDTQTSAINSEIPSNSQDLLTAREIPLQVDASTSPQATNKSPLVMRKDTTENLESEIQQQPIVRAKPLANNMPSPTQAFSSAQAEANTPLVLRKATNISQHGSPETPMISARGNEQGNLEGDLPTSKLAVSVPQVKTQSTPLVVQRQQEQVAVSREIPGNMASLPESTMVWRQSSQVTIPGNNFSDASNGGTNNSLPLAITPVHHNGQAIARQIAPARMSRTMPTSNTTMSMPRQAAMQIPEINVGEIAEQVSRILCRQLTVERERRGMRK